MAEQRGFRQFFNGDIRRCIKHAVFFCFIACNVEVGESNVILAEEFCNIPLRGFVISNKDDRLCTFREEDFGIIVFTPVHQNDLAVDMTEIIALQAFVIDVDQRTFQRFLACGDQGCVVRCQRIKLNRFSVDLKFLFDNFRDQRRVRLPVQGDSLRAEGFFKRFNRFQIFRRAGNPVGQGGEIVLDRIINGNRRCGISFLFLLCLKGCHQSRTAQDQGKEFFEFRHHTLSSCPSFLAIWARRISTSALNSIRSIRPSLSQSIRSLTVSMLWSWVTQTTVTPSFLFKS